MPNVVWKIIIPILLAFLIGMFIGWLLWRWRRTRLSSNEWNQVVERTTDAERKAARLASTNVELDARASTLDIELQAVRQHRDRVLAEHEEVRQHRDLVLSEHAEVAAELELTLSSLSESTGRVEELEDALSRARSQLRTFASMPRRLVAAQARVSGIAADLEEANDRIAALESELGANSSVEELEEELSGVSGESQDCAPMPDPLEDEPSRRVGLGPELADALTRMIQVEGELAARRSAELSLEQQPGASGEEASELVGYQAFARSEANSLARLQAVPLPTDEFTTTE